MFQREKCTKSHTDIWRFYLPADVHVLEKKFTGLHLNMYYTAQKPDDLSDLTSVTFHKLGGAAVIQRVCTLKR